MPMKLTNEELENEWEIAYLACIGRFCGAAGNPTAEQDAIALKEADAHIEALKKSQS